MSEPQITRWWHQRAGNRADPLVSMRDIHHRQRIRMLSAIILPYHIITTIFIFNYILSETLNPAEIAVLLVAFVSMSISLFLSRTRYYRTGLGLFLAVLVLNYVGFALVAEDRATIYSLTTMVVMSVFISSLFFSPRIVAYSAIGALLVIGLGVLITLWTPTLNDLMLTIGMALFFFEVILFSSYIQHETNQLIHQQTEALVESESRFRSIFDQSFHLAGFMRPDGFMIDANEKTQRLFAAYDQTLLGRHLWELPVWEHASRSGEQVREDVRQVAQGRSIHYEVTFGVPSGKRHSFDIWLRPVYNEAEAVYLLVLMGRDITAHNRRARRRQLEAARYKALFSAMRDGVMMTDLNERVTTINPKGAEMLGYTPAEMQGLPLQDIIFGTGEMNDVRRRIEQLIAGETLTPYERVLKCKNGETLPVEISSALMCNSSGKPLYVQVTFRDLTNRKRAERREIELRIERERTQLLRSFITSISHDLRTPLANIKTSNYLLGRLNGDKFKHHQGVINEAVDTLTEMVENQLAAIQDEQAVDDKSPLYFPVDVNQLVRDVVIGSQAAIQQNDNHVHVSLDTDVPLVRGNEDRLMVALRHLISNAVKFTPSGGQIEVRTSNTPERVCIHIADTGEGIPQGDLPRIFDSLYQADDARQVAGAGLGLTIANKIVTSHGGEIEVQSEVGKGSEFTVYLPKTAALHDSRD